MFGPGKYDDLASYVREQAGVEDGAVVVIIIGGNKGPGFSCQADLESTLMLPDLLEDLAKRIREDFAG
jgi:hypothetical protein